MANLLELVTAEQLEVYELTGLKGEGLGLSFSSEGNCIAICGNDPNILLFDDYVDFKKRGFPLVGHKNAVLEVCWNKQSNGTLVSCSADRTVGLWDVEFLKCLTRFKGHSDIVNSCKIEDSIIVSGSDDGTVRVWDIRVSTKESCIYEHKWNYQITAVTLDCNMSNIYCGGIENIIFCIDLRGNNIAKITGHNDTITGLDIRTEADQLVSNSMDGSIIIWDVRPYSLVEDRKLSTLVGSQHNFEKNLHRVRWNSDGDLIAAASSDCYVYIWSVKYQKLFQKLPGHTGATTDISFHPKLPIIASIGMDRRALIGKYTN
ncbi:uncharacterized protein CMU_018250 [Cryptosporidium muris RN66]|uniref:Uncharacterized protein n=1 Tax=Cryptosporidium muris (strain RN66) TaxID=441375 RepID=B6AD64_CRYMR|nr:uncharacterized protein CMU_018250 [Cryptosporidium muris RN66]EEA06068.1 hypothetical protein, conserved [Cryptosporidium muris RN66]|eukprot:XP_002140417.1 hypothetical protein [Cryptosporidium muris RN66]